MIQPGTTPAPDPQPAHPRTAGEGRDIGTVGVIICTYTAKRLDMVTDCTRSVLRQTRPADEVLLMVDATQELADRVADRLPEVRVECLGHNQGVSVARTEAARLIDTDWVVFIDDDAIAEDDWLERLVSPLGPDDVIGACGKSLPIYETGEPRWMPPEYLWALGCSYQGLPESTARVRNFFAGSAATRRDLFLGLGGFAAEVGHRGGLVGGGEEALYCMRATEASGGAFIYEPTSIAHHRLPAERLRLSYLARRCYGEGQTKARLDRMHQGDSLADERSFAYHLPLVLLRNLSRPSRWPHNVGLVVATVAVLAGLVKGRWQTRRGVTSR